MADVVATTTEPALGAIRLAWWRERLDELDSNLSPPPEPRLVAVAEQLLPCRVSGHELSGLSDAWRPLLAPFPWDDRVAEGLRLRGLILFRAGAQLLHGNPQDTEAAGALWSLVDGARHCSDVHSRIFLLDQAKDAIALLPRERPPKSLRRLTALAAVAAHDVLRNKPLDLPYADSGRGMAVFRHYWNGKLPRG